MVGTRLELWFPRAVLVAGGRVGAVGDHAQQPRPTPAARCCSCSWPPSSCAAARRWSTRRRSWSPPTSRSSAPTSAPGPGRGHDFIGVTTLGNPPSGIAGGYCFLDMVGIFVAARLASRARARGGARAGRRAGLGYDRGMSATLPLDLARYPIDDLDRPRRARADRALPPPARRDRTLPAAGLPGRAGGGAVGGRDPGRGAGGLPQGARDRGHERVRDRPVAAGRRPGPHRPPPLDADDRLRPDRPRARRSGRCTSGTASPASCRRCSASTVHRCADPLISLVISAMEPGGEQGWHFDDNEFVVSLLLQKPAVGGEFEYVPMIRSDDDPATDRIRARVRGRPRARCRWRRSSRARWRCSAATARCTGCRRWPRAPTRLIALLSFDQRAGHGVPGQGAANNTGSHHPARDGRTPTSPGSGTTGRASRRWRCCRALQRAHVLSVPFENLDIHLGRRLVLDREANYAKIVERRRGGWCYELNGAFGWLLEQLGYRVTLLGSRVEWDGGAEPRAGARAAAGRPRPARTWSTSASASASVGVTPARAGGRRRRPAGRTACGSCSALEPRAAGGVRSR